jgi:glycerol-3-phosphate acyltransferase PlsX
MENTEQKIRIALDAMGGDYAPSEIVKGAVMAAEKGGIEISLVGHIDDIKAELLKYDTVNLPIHIVHAEDIIPEGSNPAISVRKMPKSSIAIAARMVKEQEADGFMSAGPTGSIVTAALQYLGMIDGIKRPVIGGAIFDTAPDTVVFDCGVNMDCKPYHLLTFAVVGHSFCSKFLGIKKPKIGLLNIGAEKDKGNLLTKEAYPLLKKSGLNFIGNIEGNQMTDGTANVVVCDGFVGNVIFKFCGSVGLFHDLAATSGNKQGGGIIFGINGIVRKVQGSSRAQHVAATIHQTKEAIRTDFIDALKAELRGVITRINV